MAITTLARFVRPGHVSKSAADAGFLAWASPPCGRIREPARFGYGACPKKGCVGMGDNQNWYRQLLALVLLSASKAAVEYITNPGSREEATKQLRDAFAQIDYDAAAKALTRAIDDAASTSKDRIDEAIDTL